MSLRDWKWDAEQYRDIDRAAQADAEAELAKQSASSPWKIQRPGPRTLPNCLRIVTVAPRSLNLKETDMAVTKKSTKPAAKPTTKKPAAKKAASTGNKKILVKTPEVTVKLEKKDPPATTNCAPEQAAETNQAIETKQATEKAAAKKKSVRPPSGEDKKLELLRPALESLMTQKFENEREANEKLGLVDVPAAEGSLWMLLEMKDKSKKPTIQQRVAMARRAIEIHDRGGRFIPGFTASKEDRKLVAADQAAGVVADAASGPKTPKKAVEKANGAPALENGVPLKKICTEIDIDPKLARRILRSRGNRPTGRWEWEPKDVEGVKEVLKAEHSKLKAAGKA